MELLNEEIIKRFFDKVDIPEENLFACWEWTAAKNKKGYGRFKSKNSTLAHRFSYLIWNKKFPDNFACHSCDNPSCVNPLHLWDGTNTENVRDSIIKNRYILSYGNKKLTEKQVFEIRNADYNLMKLAEKYKVSKENISMIIRRKTWKHI
jgi:hypothetical protein